ncbi:hypothetical protein ACHAW6_006653, partial [Cyclotella cf. meneghiniana]
MRHSLTTPFTSAQNPDIPEDDNLSLTTPFSCQQDIDLPDDDIRHQQEGLDTMGDSQQDPYIPKKKMPKRKRILSAKLHSKKNQKITKQAPDCVEETSASLNGSGPCVRQLFQSRSATSYISNAVLKSNLKSTLSKLSAANSTIIDQDKKLSAISKKASDLTGIVRRNRAATKEARLSLATAAR